MHEANVVVTELARSAKHALRDWRVRVGLGLILLVILSSLTVYRFSDKSAEIPCAFQISESGTAPETKGDAFKVDRCLHLEVAATESARTLGLSGRQSMPVDRGVLFDFRTSGEYCMWMKDMHFPLDMLWLNKDKEIVYITEDIAPETYPKSFCGPSSARYVVEVNKGIVKAGDLHVGQHIRF